MNNVALMLLYDHDLAYVCFMFKTGWGGLPAFSRHISDADYPDKAAVIHRGYQIKDIPPQLFHLISHYNHKA